MSDNSEVLTEFEEFCALADDLPDALPDEISALYDVVSRSGSEDSLLFTLKRKEDGRLFALRRAPLATGRAEREYEILTSVNVSGVPRAVSYLESGDFGWLVRDYAEGSDLAAVVASRGTLTAAETSDIICRLCDVLAALNSQKPPVVHRDVKPQNVILAPDGGVTLIDFDAARRFDASASADTEYLGTRAFAPPEQFGYAQTDSRSDIYSLGVLLLYLYTGSCELERSSELPEPLRSVFSRCTAFSPTGRFTDARMVKAALTGEGARTRRVSYVALALAALALVVGLFSLARGGAGAPSASDEALKGALALTSGEGVYMIGSESFATREEYYAARSANPETYTEGAVSSLAYLTDNAPGIRELMLVNQPLDSLEGLAALESLENLSLDYCGLTALDTASWPPRLAALSLTDTAVADIAPLASCASLDNLCVRGVPCSDFSALEGFKRFNFLDIASIPASLTLPHLEGCSVAILKLDRATLASLDELGGISDIETLEINDNPLTSLAGIERWPALTYLNLARCPIVDFTPLAGLAKLETVVCDPQQRAALEALGADFEIVS